MFHEQNNQKLPFYTAERDPQTVAFMVKEEDELMYYEDERVQVLDLPYYSQRWFARIVLPKKSLAKDGTVFFCDFDLTPC